MRPLKTRRDFLKLAGLAGAALAAPPWVAACGGDPTGPASEGLGLDGSWDRLPVDGYAGATSYRPGATAEFHLSDNSDARWVRVDVLRVGAADTLVAEPWPVRIEPQSVPDDAAQSGCRWPPAFQLAIPSTWRSGVYLARVWSAGPWTRSWASPAFAAPTLATSIPFVIKAASRTSSMLYQLPVATYQAYNEWGGSSLYTRDAQGFTPPFVSFDRPYRHLPSFKQWDLRFIRWMERAGLSADYCTSLDLHGDPELRLSASGYRLFLSVGHDEYWSWEMRDNVEEFIASGGNVAFFGGNTCWWQIRLDSDARRIVCYKDHPQQGSRRDPAWGWGPEGQRRVTTNWSASPVNRPEEQMTGLSSRFGAGFHNSRNRMPLDVPFHVGPSDHWVFAGASLAGGTFGQGTVGHETDAACVRVNPDGSLAVDRANIPIISEDAGDGRIPYWPPDSIIVLASTELLRWPGRVGRATMALYRRTGAVFNAATTNWPSGLWLSDPVRTITRNVLRRLTSVLPPSPSLANLGFDEWLSSTQPVGWHGGAPAEPVPQVFQETRSDLVRGGPASLRMNVQAGSTWLGQDFSASGGEYYVVSGWIRSEGAISDNDGRWLAISLQQTGTGEDFATARYTATDGQWQHVRAYGRVAVTGTFSARVQVASSFPGDAWFDDLRVDVL